MNETLDLASGRCNRLAAFFNDDLEQDTRGTVIFGVGGIDRRHVELLRNLQSRIGTVDPALLAATAEHDVLPPTTAIPVQPSWKIALFKISRLQKGWNGYDADPPKPQSIDAAFDFLRVAAQKKLEAHRIEASVMGGVGVTYRKGDRKVYVEFYDDGTVHSLFSDRSGKMRTMTVTARDEAYRDFIEQAGEYLDGRDSA